jgi:hypothetical protein
MASALLPTTREIETVFREEVDQAGGRLGDRFDDGDRLFLRSVLPVAREVRPNDSVQSGVALMTIDQDIYVHPYTFRQACRNGFIMARAIQTRRIHRVESDAPVFVPVETEIEIRDVVRLCATTEVFSTAAERMRSATERRADRVIELIALISRLPMIAPARMLPAIVGRFQKGRDNSLFGLVNAVTSVARDEPDPEIRWHLEELGGSMLIPVPPTSKPDSALAGLAVRV